MNIEVKDEGNHIDFYVDGNHAARMEFITPKTYRMVFSNDALSPLILHQLFLTVLKQRAGQWSNP